MVSVTTSAIFLLTPRYECGGTTSNMPDAAFHNPVVQMSPFLVISRGRTAEWIILVLFDPLFLDFRAIGNDLPVDKDELGRSFY